MPKFVKKPIMIEATRWTGHNLEAIKKWSGNPECFVYGPGPGASDDLLMINTLEGHMSAQVGDWIIKGVKGELYPCKPDIFDATYEEVIE